MARRRRGRKGRRKGKMSIALLPTVIAAYPTVKAYQTVGLTKDLPAHIVYQYTGYAPWDGTWNKDKPIKLGTGLVVGFVGHKVANKLGVNRHIRKLTMGYLSL